MTISAQGTYTSGCAMLFMYKKSALVKVSTNELSTTHPAHSTVSTTAVKMGGNAAVVRSKKIKMGPVVRMVLADSNA